MTRYNSYATEHSADIVAAPGVETDALAPLNAFMNAWNTRDVAGMNAAFHFPHVRIASSGINVMEQPPPDSSDFFEKFVASTGWHHSLWDYRRAVQSSRDKVHFAVQFTRYREDGSVIGEYPSMWVVTNLEGRWGVQARSSFAP